MIRNLSEKDQVLYTFVDEILTGREFCYHLQC